MFGWIHPVLKVRRLKAYLTPFIHSRQGVIHIIGGVGVMIWAIIKNNTIRIVYWFCDAFGCHLPLDVIACDVVFYDF